MILIFLDNSQVSKQNRCLKCMKHSVQLSTAKHHHNYRRIRHKQYANTFKILTNLYFWMTNALKICLWFILCKMTQSFWSTRWPNHLSTMRGARVIPMKSLLFDTSHVISIELLNLQTFNLHVCYRYIKNK